MSPRTGRRYQSIVDRAEHIARLHSSEPLHILELCQICGVTERTLRSAFKSIHGKTPHRYLRDVRMLEARRALLLARPLATVTLIATQFGFLELGRFSVEYRSIFGERPSETLKRSALLDGGAEYRNSNGNRVVGRQISY